MPFRLDPVQNRMQFPRPQNDFPSTDRGILNNPRTRHIAGERYFLATGTLTQPEVLSVNSRQLKQ